MHPDRDEIYTEWLAAAPKGVRWDKAQEMWEEYQLKRKKDAAIIAKRILGMPKTWKECPDCFGWGKAKGKTCMTCLGEGRLDVY